MKKISLIIRLAALITGVAVSQNLDDALRYSQVFYSGTARFNAMGGAFTALGADMSTLSQNPAGIGMYRSSEFSFTPSLDFAKSTTTFGNISEDYINKFNFGQAGYVANVFQNVSNNKSFIFNVGIAYNRTNNLNQQILVSGINNTSSIADSWVMYSNGTYYRDLTGAEGIAYDVWVIDTITGSGGNRYGTVYSYWGDNSSIYGQKMKRTITYEGSLGELALSFGGNYSDKIYFGATLGINKLRFSSYSEHAETTDKQLPSKFRSLNFVEYYENDGAGFTFKLGAIVKPVEMLRIGVAFHTPTYYKISEYFYDSFSAKFTDVDLDMDRDKNNFSFKSDPNRYNYALRTPLRVLTGVAVQIQKFALLSVDYEYLDYGSALFSQTGDGYNYSDKNRDIKNSLTTASNIRVGGELRLNNLYLRSGYGYYGKPYKANELNANLDYRTISGGIGFRAKNVSFDFAYVNYKSIQNNLLYQLPSNFNAAGYDLTTEKNSFTLTLGAKF
jgi:hypothetical protein